MDGHRDASREAARNLAAGAARHGGCTHRGTPRRANRQAAVQPHAALVTPFRRTRRNMVRLTLKDIDMTTLDSLSERALGLAGHAGDSLRGLAPKASTLLNAGMKMGAARAGARAGLMVVRRNPVIAVATLAGAGLLWYAARRRARRAEAGNGQTLEGSSRRIETRSGDSETAGRTRTRAPRKAAGTRRASGSRSRTANRESRTEH
ncbi:hypothetical protein [Cognatilysobacter segetis]|uniref:hypothetical protein n=1 Tax=Cognatilysobacter segetis TaxID=2492394 RepID=UPI00105FD58F|nr:hypothetical protein [Lysobacter segetis]